MDLRKLVLDKITSLGVKDASTYFGVSTGTISNWKNGLSSPSIHAVQLVVGEQLAITSPQEVIQPVEAEPEMQWDGRELFILLPVYHQFNPDTNYTIFANYAKYGPEKIGVYQTKRTMIHESRNSLAHKFLNAKTGKRAIMVDSDMVLPWGDPVNFMAKYPGLSEKQAAMSTFSRLMSHPMDKGIVGGLYFGRHRKGKAQCASGFDNPAESDKFRKGLHVGLKPEEWVGTGCFSFTKDVLLQMKAHIDAGNWPECKPLTPDLPYGFFNPIQTGVGEDISFCRRAKQIGIQTYVDASLVLLHEGPCLWGPKNTFNE